MPYEFLARSAAYPATVAEVLDAPVRVRFRRATLRAVRRFARSRPWHGDEAHRFEKFRRLNRDLALVYGIRRPLLMGERIGARDEIVRGNGSYQPATHTIRLVGRLSVVTFLHEFGHALGFDERRTCRWSINLFRRCFPRSFGSCRQVGHMLLRR